eukprot:1703755-Amphidinium_carterae.1
MKDQEAKSQNEARFFALSNKAIPVRTVNCARTKHAPAQKLLGRMLVVWGRGQVGGYCVLTVAGGVGKKGHKF